MNRPAMNRVSNMKSRDFIICLGRHLHEFGNGIEARMNITNINKKIVPPHNSKTRAGLMNSNTAKGMPTRPTVI